MIKIITVTIIDNLGCYAIKLLSEMLVECRNIILNLNESMIRMLTLTELLKEDYNTFPKKKTILND